MGCGRRAATAADIRRALTLYRGGDALLLVVNAGVTLPVLVARHR